MSTDVLRSADPEDGLDVAQLASQLGYPCDELTMRGRIEFVRLDPKRDLIVIERDGRVRGWIEVAIIELIANDPFCEIHGLIVHEQFRGTSLGRQLVAAAESWAAERGLDRVRVRSNVARDRARKFYESLGYTVTKVSNVFDKIF